MALNTSELASQIEGTVLTPVDTGYAESIQRWAENAERKAAAVVLVTSSADVAAAVPLFSCRTTDFASSRSRRKMNSKSPLAGDVIRQLAPLLLKAVLSLT